MFRPLAVAALATIAACGEPTPAYDVVYAKEWKFSVAGPVDGFALVVNTGKAPLSLASLTVKSVTDDHATATVRITASPATSSLAPGTAGGKLSGLADTLFAPMAPEPRGDASTSYLAIEVADAPPGTYDINAKATIRLDGVDATLTMLIHVVPGPTVYADPIAAARVSLNR
ncbi:MAG: hypothetical protein IPH44_38525 [Myxococcales bacterium]|nr:hypothetical protein [Myxococcales bacterium]MBK7197622.1 hypothetical protein [Myxococcales bacterium]